MPSPNDPGERAKRRGRRRRWFVRLAASGLLASGFCACSNFGQKQQPTTPVSDPLLGGPPINQAMPPPSTQTSSNAQPQPSTVPPAIPTGVGSTPSAATLAAGVSRPADDGRDLRIGSAPRDSGGWARAGTPPAAGDAGGAKLRGPEPVVEPVSRRDPMQSPNLSAAAPPDTYRQLQAQLSARGVTWQRLETMGTDGQWTFSCSIPSRQNPNVNRQYRATARTDLEAIQEALKQIEKEN